MGSPGRPKGSRNKASIARQAAIAASGLTPLEYMMDVLRNPKATTARRDWAAGAAAPYVHPKLSSTVLKGDLDAPLVHRIERTIVDPTNVRTIEETWPGPIPEPHPNSPAAKAVQRDTFVRSKG